MPRINGTTEKIFRFYHLVLEQTLKLFAFSKCQMKRTNPSKLRLVPVFILVTVLTLAPLNLSFQTQKAEAAINQQINYQGKLTDSSGNAVSDASYSIVFSLYTTSTGGSNIWTETQSVTATSGLFSVMLGSVSSLAGVNFNQTLYLGVNVEADGEMTPRKVLGAVPASFESLNSDKLDGLTASDFLLATTTNATATITTLNVTGLNVSNSTTTNATTTNLNVSGTASTSALIVSGNASLQTITSGTWNGNTIGVAYGGTGLSTYTTGDLLYASGPTTLAGTSTTNLKTTLALNNVENTALSTWAGSTNLTTLGTIATGVWNGTIIGDSYLTKTGDWTGTLDGQEGSYYLNASNLTNFGSPFYTYFSATTTDALTQGSTNLYYADTLVNAYLHASTTVAKAYSDNTFTGSNIFNGALTLATLNGPLQANGGVVSATTSVGVLYGGTGLTSAPAYGEVLLGNGSGGYTLTATTSLGISGGGSGTINSGTTGQFPYYAGSGTELTATSSLYLDTASNVGIGTTTPSSNSKLTIEQNGGDDTWGLQLFNYGTSGDYLQAVNRFGLPSINLKQNSGGDGLINIYDLSGNTDIVLHTNGASYFNGGNVGIGTTTPTYKFNVTGADSGVNFSRSADENQNIRITTDGTDNRIESNGNKALRIYTNTANDIRFGTNGATDQLNLQSGGNVGIGTASPQSSLQVSSSTLSEIRINVTGGAVSDTARLNFYGNSGRSLARIDSVVGGSFVGDLRFFTNSTGVLAAETENMRITGAGLVGIGTTTPYAKLSVTNTGSSPSFVVEDSTSPDSTPFIIDASGKVAIGSLTATYNLNVVGSSANGVLNLENSGNGNTSGIVFTRERLSGASVPAANIYVNSDTSTNNTELVLQVNSSTSIGSKGATDQRMVFDAAGNTIYTENANFGIGDTSPASLLTVGASDAFQINDSGVVTAGTWNGGTIPIAYGGTNATSQTTNGVNYFNGTSITSGSNLTYDGSQIINLTNSSGTALNVNRFSSQGQGISISSQIDGLGASLDGNHIRSYGSKNLTFGTFGNGTVRMYANSTEALRLNTDGSTFVVNNLGVGDSTPASALTVGNGDLFQVNSSGAIAASTGLQVTGNATITGTVTLNAKAYTFPASYGSSGYYLQNNGSGTLSWASVSGSSAAGSNGQVQYNSGGSFSAEAEFFYDPTPNVLQVATTSSYTTGGIRTPSINSYNIFVTGFTNSSATYISSGGAFGGNGSVGANTYISIGGNGASGNANGGNAGDVYLAVGGTRSGSGTIGTSGNVYIGSGDFSNGNQSANLYVYGTTNVMFKNSGTTNGVCHSGSNTSGPDTTNTYQLVACSGVPADIAEFYPTVASVEPGDIIAPSIDEFTYEAGGSNPYTGQVESLGQKKVAVMDKATKDTGFLGVISTGPYQTFGRDILNARTESTAKPVALVGRVPVKVNGENGSIRPGDRITISSIPGVGMKATGAGMTLGIALQSFSGTTQDDQDKIMVFVNTSFASISETVAEGDISADLWQRDEVTGKITAFGTIDLNGQAIENIKSLASFTGSWSISEEGVLVVEEIQANKVTVENELTAQKGLTTKDAVTGEYYCIYISNGSLTSNPGKCEDLNLTPPDTSGGDTEGGSTDGNTSTTTATTTAETTGNTGDGGGSTDEVADTPPPGEVVEATPTPTPEPEPEVVVEAPVVETPPAPVEEAPSGGEVGNS